MKIHRFIGDFDLASSVLTLREKKLVHQLDTVLRLRVGEVILLSDGKGVEARYRILKIAPTSVSLERQDQCSTKIESPSGVTLCCALLKRENFELVVQKATEIGVDEIIPLHTARTVKQGIKLERLERIAKEAAEQSGRTRVPHVQEPMSLEEAMAHTQQSRRYVCDVRAEWLLQDALSRSKSQMPCALFIGPEGGWTESEIQEFQASGPEIVGLGDFTLRAETAAMIAVYLAIHR